MKAKAIRSHSIGGPLCGRASGVPAHPGDEEWPMTQRSWQGADSSLGFALRITFLLLIEMGFPIGGVMIGRRWKEPCCLATVVSGKH